MTAQEKAEELVDKYRDTIMSFLSDNMKDMNAKKCALITVDEILHALEYKYTHNHEELCFYEEVKREIEKL